MYYINKIVSWVLSPLGMFFIGIGAGFGLLYLKKFASWKYARRVGGGLIVLSMIFLWVMCTRIVTPLLGLPLEGDEVSCDDLPAADAIVLLGGGVGIHEKCGRYEIQSGSDRTVMAAHLWKAGKAPIITVSGGCAKVEKLFLKELGVNIDLAVKEFAEARNTQEEARFILDGLGLGEHPNIILVTSSWHMPRAKMLFENAGFKVTPAPCDYEAHMLCESKWKPGDFFPSGDALWRNSYLFKEWVARFCYAIIGKR